MDHVTELTPGQLVARWNGLRTLGTLKNWRHRGLGPDFHVVNHRVFYRLEDVEAFERSHPLEHMRASPKVARAANRRHRRTVQTTNAAFRSTKED